MNIFNQSFPIGNRRIGQDAPCFIIAEAGSNHNRDFKMAMQLIDVAAKTKADAIKFQTFSADTIASQADIPLTHINFAGAKTPHELFKKLEIDRGWHKDLYDYAKYRGLMFLSTPFDEQAVDELFEVGIEAYKIASFEINHFPLLAKVAQTGKPILLSTGMSSLGDIEEALEVIYTHGGRSVALLHCGISYPLLVSDVNLRAMETLYNAFQCPVGYSDHTVGITIPLAAVARQAKIIEKHFTLNRGLDGPDHAFAIEPDELNDMVISIRDVEKALGSSSKGPADVEGEFKRRGRRSLFARVAIPKGTILEKDMLSVLRPGAGLHPRYMEVLINRKTIRDIKAHDPITWDCFLSS